MLKKISPLFLIFLFFLPEISSSEGNPFFSEPLEELSESLEGLQVALLFCDEDTSNEDCAAIPRNAIYRKHVVEKSKLPDFTKKLTQASIHFKIDIGGTCTGTIVKLKKDGQACKKAQYHLITTGHCIMETRESSVDYVRSLKIKRTQNTTSDFSLSFSKDIEDLTRPPYCTSEGKDCLLNGLDFSLEYEGSDQAILPISQKNLPPDIKPLEIDIKDIVNKKEMFSCLYKKKSDIYFSQILRDKDIKTLELNNSHLGSQVFKCEGSKLSDPYKYLASFFKPMLSHRCPTINGTSGSMGHTKCEKKQALFIHSFNQSNKKASLEKKNNLPVPPHLPYYAPKTGFDSYGNINMATHLDSELLEFYFERVCEGNISSTISKISSAKSDSPPAKSSSGCLEKEPFLEKMGTEIKNSLYITSNTGEWTFNPLDAVFQKCPENIISEQITSCNNHRHHTIFFNFIPKYICLGKGKKQIAVPVFIE